MDELPNKYFAPKIILLTVLLVLYVSLIIEVSFNGLSFNLSRKKALNSLGFSAFEKFLFIIRIILLMAIINNA